jgi:hypothetical protein
VKTRDKWHQARHRPEIDDRPALPALDQILAEDLTAEEHPLQIDLHDAIELVLANIEVGRRGVHPGAIDHDIHAAGALQHRGRAAPAARSSRWPRPGRNIPCRRRLDPIQPGLGLVGVAPHQRHLGAGGGQAFAHGTAQLAGAADYDRNLAGQGIQ